MKLLRLRRLAAIGVLGAVGAFSCLTLSSPWPDDDFKDLRDSVGDHGVTLSAGHASLGAGAASCMFCHLPHQAKTARALWSSASFDSASPQVGEARTELCLSCHDGTVASAQRAHLSAGQNSAVGGVNLPHPVGADYLSAFRRNPDAYNEPNSNPRIILEDGKVGCVSCHATHDLSAVTVSSVRREVCIECHRR